jgi:hypothetical protein
MNIGLAIGIMPSPIAACKMFLITYDEYRKHFPDWWTPMLYSLRAAGVTVPVFLFMSEILGWLLSHDLISIRGRNNKPPARPAPYDDEFKQTGSSSPFAPAMVGVF